MILRFYRFVSAVLLVCLLLEQPVFAMESALSNETLLTNLGSEDISESLKSVPLEDQRRILSTLIQQYAQGEERISQMSEEEFETLKESSRRKLQDVRNLYPSEQIEKVNDVTTQIRSLTRVDTEILFREIGLKLREIEGSLETQGSSLHASAKRGRAIASIIDGVQMLASMALLATMGILQIPIFLLQSAATIVLVLFGIGAFSCLAVAMTILSIPLGFMALCYTGVTTTVGIAKNCCQSAYAYGRNLYYDATMGGLCGICDEPLGNSGEDCRLDCQHKFHYACFRLNRSGSWYPSSNNCPKCNSDRPTRR